MSTVVDRTIEISMLGHSNLAVKIDIPASLEIMDNPSDTPRKGCGAMRVMTPKDGDKRVVWDSFSLGQIRDAKAMFDDCVAKGLLPHRVGIDGKQTAEIMTEFDPTAEEIIFVPVALVAGG